MTIYIAKKEIIATTTALERHMRTLYGLYVNPHSYCENSYLFYKTDKL